MVTAAQQTTGTLLMIRPSGFGFNKETADTNIFQQSSSLPEDLAQQALQQFDDLVNKLRKENIYVMVLQSPLQPHTPDALFPNNWISFQGDCIALYPMLALNRRLERRHEWVAWLQVLFNKKEIKDFTSNESRGLFLEGTGSMVLDRQHRVAYANLSSRTNPALVRQWCEQMAFEPVLFHAHTGADREIYHTNVMMAIGEKTAVICGEVLHDADEKAQVLSKLALHHELIDITESQMQQFAGNLLLVNNREGKKFWVMSDAALHAFTPQQLRTLEKDGKLISSRLEVIEQAGGGSARCMLAEIF